MIRARVLFLALFTALVLSACVRSLGPVTERCVRSPIPAEDGTLFGWLLRCDRIRVDTLP